MLDVRPVAYIAPVAEQPIGPITPKIRIISAGDESSTITGVIRIYRKSTDQLLYTSELPVTVLPGRTTVDLEALTPWNPPAPADDDYFILCGTSAVNPLVPDGFSGHLGAYTFDVKTVPMGPVPAGHHTTHERGGMDPIDVADLGTTEMDVTLVLAPDGAGGVEFHAETGGGGATLTPFLLKTTVEMNAIPAPTEGMAVWNTDLHQVMVYDGTAWVGLAMTL